MNVELRAKSWLGNCFTSLALAINVFIIIWLILEYGVSPMAAEAFKNKYAWPVIVASYALFLLIRAPRRRASE
jgi:O-antigen/teichoic acid export membrane protein